MYCRYFAKWAFNKYEIAWHIKSNQSVEVLSLTLFVKVQRI